MATHVKKPYFRYSPTGFNPTTAKFKATHKFTFREQPPTDGSTTSSDKQMMVFFHQELIEEMENESSGPNQVEAWKTLHTISSSIIDGDGVIYGSVKPTPENPDSTFEEGTFMKLKNITTSGEVKMSRNGGSMDLWLTTDGRGYGPIGSSYAYNCSGDTMFFSANAERRDYFFNRSG